MQLQVLSDALAGKRVEVAVNESAYWRSFGGDQSPEDLETALQLVYRCVRVVGSALCHNRSAAGQSDVLTSYNICANCRLFTERVEAVDSRLATCKRSDVLPAAQLTPVQKDELKVAMKQCNYMVQDNTRADCIANT